MQDSLLVLGGQHVLPGWHGGVGFALGDCAQQFFIRFGGGCRGDEIARSRGEKRGFDAVALAARTMAFYAMLAIEGLPVVEIFGGLGEQDAGSTAGQEESEKEAVGHRTNHDCLCRCRSLQNLATEGCTIFF